MKSAKRTATKAFLVLHIIVMAVYILYNLTFLSDAFFSLTAKLLRAWIDLDSDAESFGTDRKVHGDLKHNKILFL